jgi:hydroxymethylglutaryl-CoA synthase
MEPVPLARRGIVHTYVVNQTMPAPFVAPLPIAVVDLEDGARIMLQAVGTGDDIEIGTEVELVLRKYAHERGVPVYGWKVRVVPQLDGGAEEEAT